MEKQFINFYYNQLDEGFLKNFVNKLKPIIPNTFDKAINWFYEYLAKMSPEDIKVAQDYIGKLPDSTVTESILSKGKMATFLFILFSLMPNVAQASNFMDSFGQLKQKAEKIEIQDVKKAVKEMLPDMQELADDYKEKVEKLMDGVKNRLDTDETGKSKTNPDKVPLKKIEPDPEEQKRIIRSRI
jgi:hypothetical protein